MQLPAVPGLTSGLTSGVATLASLAAFVRERLGEFAPLWPQRHDGRPTQDGGLTSQPTLVVVGAAAPFAATSYARARLLRQMHASGLLDDRETEQAEQLFGVAQ